MTSKLQPNYIFESLRQRIKQIRKPLQQQKPQKHRVHKTESCLFEPYEQKITFICNREEIKYTLKGHHDVLVKPKVDLLKQQNKVVEKGSKGRGDSNNKIQNKKEEENKIIRLNLNKIISEGREGEKVKRRRNISIDQPEIKSNNSQTRSRFKSISQKYHIPPETNFPGKRKSSSTFLSPPLFSIPMQHRSILAQTQQQTPRFQKHHSIKTYHHRNFSNQNPITHPPFEKTTYKKMFPGKNWTPGNLCTEHFKSNPNLYVSPQKDEMVLKQRDGSRERREKGRSIVNLSMGNLGEEEGRRRSNEKKHFERRGNERDRVGGLIRQF